MEPIALEPMKLLFLGKAKEPRCVQAAQLVVKNVPNAEIYLGDRSQPWPRVKETQYDIVLSYLSPWIVPQTVLAQARRSAINFHPGPPEYPGIGCTNFAIYHDAKEYGVTCHHMAASVDSGKIIMVKRFPLYPDDSVYSLTERCYDHIYLVFEEIWAGLVQDRPLPQSKESWKRKPYRRSELNELCRLTPEMSDEEVRRRVRATTFPGCPGAYLEKTGFRFVLK